VTFEECLRSVLDKEGGYSNHAWDNGGATNHGITIATLSEWRGKAQTPGDVKALTKEEASAIYRKWYWEPVSADRLPPGVDLCVFHFAVNAGPDRAAKLLQEVLKVEADGEIGPATLAAAKKRDPLDLIARYHTRLARYYMTLGDFPVAGNGWLARLFSVAMEAGRGV
jgi:lysozyme family protein